jgi:hypothetical protein
MKKKSHLDNQKLGRRILVGRGTNGSSSGSTDSTSNNQLSTLCVGGITTKFRMAREDMTIWLLEFHGEGSKDPEKHFLFVKRFEKIIRSHMKIQKWHNL